MKDTKPCITWDDFDKLDLRTATVVRAEKHPQADNLLILTCNLNDEDMRVIVAGIAQHYTPEEVNGMQIIIVANLEPRILRGVMSQGMLLAVRDPNGLVPGDNTKTQEVLSLLTPDKFVAAGLRAS